MLIFFANRPWLIIILLRVAELHSVFRLFIGFVDHLIKKLIKTSSQKRSSFNSKPERKSRNFSFQGTNACWYQNNSRCFTLLLCYTMLHGVTQCCKVLHGVARCYLTIGLIAVFDVILTGRQSGQKLQWLYGNPIANNSGGSSGRAQAPLILGENRRND